MPNKSSPAYWHDRKVQYDETLGKDEKRLYSKLAAYYEREAARLDKEIAAYYAKYSINGVLSYRNLLETLPDEDKLLLIEQLDEFVKKYPAYADLVPVRESIYKLNRLEGLRQSIAMQQLHMGAYEQQQALAFFQRQALRYANGAASFLGLGSSFCRLDSDVIRATVGNKWCDGKDFSERIWDNRKKLGNTLHTQFVNGVIRGDDYHQLARQIRAKFVKVSQKNAERLTFTEDTYLSNEAAMQVFEREAAVTEYEYVCTGDAETCDICRGLNGERFPISQRMPGTNFPPMHPWCRCFFDPVIPEKKTLTSGADSGIIEAERPMAAKTFEKATEDEFELAKQIMHTALLNCGLDENDTVIQNYLGGYACDNPAEFIAEAFSSTNNNVLVNEVKRLLSKKWGCKMSMLFPPKEIMRNIRIHNGSVYLVGEVTEEQKKIFQKFKKQVDEEKKKSRVETD